MGFRRVLTKLKLLLTNNENIALVHKQSQSGVNGTTAAACVTPTGEILWVETSWNDAEIRKAKDVFTARKCTLVRVYVGGGWLL